jgi:hypothetical protein
METHPTPEDIALCPRVNIKYATRTAGVKAIRTTDTSPVTFRAQYYSKNKQCHIGRFSSIMDAAAAIWAADLWVHDGPHDGQSQMLSNDLVSPFLFGKSNREGLKLNYITTTGQGRCYHEMENSLSQSPSKGPMRGSKMPQVPPACASACEPSESVGSFREIRIACLIITCNKQVAL